MSHVEAFATGIKIESSDQSPFWGLIKVTSELNQWIKNTEGNDQAIKHTFCQSKTLIPVANA